MTPGMKTVTTLMLCAPIGAITMLAAGSANAATPTYYADLATFQADITTTVTDDYSNPGYAFIQNNAAMSAVVGETDYMSTGFNDLNIVSNGQYCAGCNGSFELSFLTTTVGNAAGVNGVGMLIPSHDQGTPYFAFITFADGTTENIALPPAGSFWGVGAPERVERIHIGLSMGATTTSGTFSIDDLIVGDGSFSDSDCCTASASGTPGCTDAVCEAAVCASDPFCCSNSWDGLCANGALNLCPALCGIVCGDGMVAGGEQCDDGGESAACDADCTFASCGDLTVNAAAGEQCDDGGQSAACDADCTLATCGDGLVNAAAGEACDDGGESATCDADCTAVTCGDGEANTTAGEACDDGGESATCNDDCTAAACGDGVTNASAGEDCDDGNTDDGDGCAADCTAEEPGTTGDPGNTDDTGMADDTGMGDGTDSGGSDIGDTEGVTSGIDTGATGDDSGTGADGGVIPPPDFSPCNCTTTPPRQGRLWWLMVALGLFVRRRRSA